MFKKIAILCLVMLISLITCLTAVSSNDNMIPALFQTEENLLKDYIEGLPDIEIKRSGLNDLIISNEFRWLMPFSNLMIGIFCFCNTLLTDLL